MSTWSAQDAEARFTAFLDACLDEGPQVVTRCGAETAVLVPIEAWRTMREAARPTLKELLLTDEGRFEMEIPTRGRWRSRPGPDLD